MYCCYDRHNVLCVQTAARARQDGARAIARLDPVGRLRLEKEGRALKRYI
jgi:hypothetical protein